MIPTRQLGKSGPKVGALALGCMGMSEFYGQSNDAESIATIHAALDAGANLLDTADMYGPFINEELLGRAIKGRRKQVVLATKFGIVRDASNPKSRAISGRPEYVRAACDASLKRLGIETIDLYYQHRVDPTTPIEDTVGAMAALVREGKVRHLGLSEASATTLRRASKVHPISALQSEYSLWTRDAEGPILDTCKELGIALVAFSPVGRGFLTGQIKSPNDFPEGDLRRTLPRFVGENFQKNLDLVTKVKDLAAEKHCTPAQLALAWVLSRGQNVIPLFGTKRRTYLQENLGAMKVTLTPDDLRRIDAAFPKDAAAGARYGESGMKTING